MSLEQQLSEAEDEIVVAYLFGNPKVIARAERNWSNVQRSIHIQSQPEVYKQKRNQRRFDRISKNPPQDITQFGQGGFTAVFIQEIYIAFGYREFTKGIGKGHPNYDKCFWYVWEMLGDAFYRVVESKYYPGKFYQVPVFDYYRLEDSNV